MELILPYIFSDFKVCRVNKQGRMTSLRSRRPRSRIPASFMALIVVSLLTRKGAAERAAAARQGKAG